MTRHSNHKYHVEMLKAELKDLLRQQEQSFQRGPTDTRVYLSLDRTEAKLIDELLFQELAAIARYERNEG